MLQETFTITDGSEHALPSTFTANETFRPDSAIVQITSGVPCYYTLDGSTPSASNGFLLPVGKMLYLGSRSLVLGVKFARASASTVTLTVSDMGGDLLWQG